MQISSSNNLAKGKSEFENPRAGAELARSMMSEGGDKMVETVRKRDKSCDDEAEGNNYRKGRGLVDKEKEGEKKPDIEIRIVEEDQGEKAKVDG